MAVGRQRLLTSTPISRVVIAVAGYKVVLLLISGDSVISAPPVCRNREVAACATWTNSDQFCFSKLLADYGGAHHLRYLQPSALGLKVSDEFTVLLCRSHHSAVHRVGNERAWCSDIGIDPN